MQDIQESKPQVSIDEFRYAIGAALERGELAPVETPLTHYHTDDLYGRRILVPKNSILSTMVHKLDHITVVLKGHLTIVDQNGSVQEVKGPEVFITRAGTQRAIVVHEDVDWITVHHCTEHDEEKVRDVLGFETMKEYEECRLLEA